MIDSLPVASHAVYRRQGCGVKEGRRGPAILGPNRPRPEISSNHQEIIADIPRLP
jgi:hypothetical protein